MIVRKQQTSFECGGRFVISSGSLSGAQTLNLHNQDSQCHVSAVLCGRPLTGKNTDPELLNPESAYLRKRMVTVVDDDSTAV